ncbi:ferredoxin-NADP reductase [Propioniciclava sinopodophylli]|uniref:Ferredoxin-NADP reductase n=1 Tax=Propioniciclava sinopodophylli TaxID=1837344 RepID=A0A4Q9KEC0_9ACTN|nr:ferredoxin-NADP reductase [Propioniciclava sinopodophylli]TBT85485.1 ferredoxin-NADP reductase [Propioniciclava sinopodophylli]
MREHPRVAIVGAGPSGLYAAGALLKGDEDVRIDILDRLPTPYGLLRYGVAPDHTSLQGIQRVLAEPFASDRVRFFGLVELGQDITADELRRGYDAVVYAAGAAEDRRLDVRGEDLTGSHSAREFVAWYNGHPDAEPHALAGVEAAVTFGVGNVAVDVARILLADPGRLSVTDMPEAVLAELTGHHVADVWVVGRRGPEHATFTTTELRELLTLEGVQPVLHDPVPDDPPDADRRVRQNLEALRAAESRVVEAPRARLHLAFWRRPVELVGASAVRAVVLERTVMDATGQVAGTGEREVVPAQLVLRAIGYRGKPLPGVPFDPERGVVPHVDGRVVDNAGVRPGEYVVGWIKRGPLGVIGTNKSDAAATVRALLADLEAGQLPAPSGPDAAELLAGRGRAASTFADWERIDAAEQAAGERFGRPRVKVATWHALTDLVRHGRPGGPLEHEDDPA